MLLIFKDGMTADLSEMWISPKKPDAGSTDGLMDHLSEMLISPPKPDAGSSVKLIYTRKQQKFKGNKERQPGFSTQKEQNKAIKAIKSANLMPNIDCNDDVKLQHLCYLINLILPFLKQIREEQEEEIVVEARAEAVIQSSVKIERLGDSGERVTCDRCSTSIFGLHRYCSACKYEICLTCSKEIRSNCKKNKRRTKQSGPKSGPNLVAKKNGRLFCVSKHPETLMYLRDFLEETWISNLEKRAKKINNKFKINFPPEKHDSIFPETSGDYHIRAANREGSNDNYLYCRSSKDAKDDLISFRNHLSKGEPVVIKDVLDQTHGISWEPMVLCEHLNPEVRSELSELEVIDCLNGELVKINTEEFFKGYIEGTHMLKLLDFPSFENFDKVLPLHCAEFIEALPFREYTDPKEGILNLVVKLPPTVVCPDLGPKAYIASIMARELGRGDSVTNVHYDMSDAVNILTHTTERQDGNIIECRVGARETVARWDVFRREDAKSLEKYLEKDLKCCIHDRDFYLTSEHKRKLKDKYDVEPWAIEQCLGDAVIIPAGCAHQVRNLKSCTKVAVDFVSPENVKELLRLKQEIRELPTGHQAREDKLEINKMVLHAMDKALTDIEALMSNDRLD